MRVSILNASAGTVVNIIEAQSVARAQLFYPFCRVALPGDTIPELPLSAQEIKDQTDAADANAYSKLVALKNMTPAQVQVWVAANVNTLAQAQDAITTLAIAVSILARKI